MKRLILRLLVLCLLVASCAGERHERTAQTVTWTETTAASEWDQLERRYDERLELPPVLISLESSRPALGPDGGVVVGPDGGVEREITRISRTPLPADAGVRGPVWSRHEEQLVDAGRLEVRDAGGGADRRTEDDRELSVGPPWWSWLALLVVAVIAAAALRRLGT